jgi:hypothetical protein
LPHNSKASEGEDGVAPGSFCTLMQVYFGAPANNASTPLGRMGQPVELAPLYVTVA